MRKLFPRVSAPIRLLGVCTGCLGCSIGCLVLLNSFVNNIITRQTAKTSSCLSNEKQLATGILMYIQDYDEHFPPAPRWMDNLVPYTKNEQVFHCTEVEKDSPKGYGYALNSNIASKSLAKQETPSTTTLLFDSNWLWRNAYAPYPTSLASPPRHKDGCNNIAFIDGHVHAVKDPSLYSQ